MPEIDDGDDSVERLWRFALTETHHGPFWRWPSSNKCTICHTPFSGISGQFAKLSGRHPSSINPHICNYCEDVLPPGGAEIDVAVLFADIRGSTQLAESMSTREFTALMNRFYKVASSVLIRRRGYIDKLIGDEVMGFFIPRADHAGYRQLAVEAAVEMLEQVGYKSGQDPWLPLAIGIHASEAFVGKVGSEGVYSFTVIGDTVNTAARLRSEAQAGEILLGESIYQSVAAQYPDLNGRDMTVRGKSEPLHVFSLRPAGVLR